MGAPVLVVGVVLFGYGSLTIPSLFDKLRYMYAHPVETAVNAGMGLSPFGIVEQQLFLMQLLQLIGLLMAVSGAILLVYSLGMKKEMRMVELSQRATG